MAEKENPIEAGEKKVEALIKSEPWYVWAGAAAAAGVIVYFIYKRRKAAASASSSTTGQTPDANGIVQDTLGGLSVGTEAGGYNYQGGPVDNYPFAEVGVNGNNVPVVPSGMTPIYDSNGNLIGWQEPSPTTSPNPTPTETGTIRAVETTGTTAAYDKAHPGGIPFRATPGGSVLSEIPYGTNVTITGNPIQGSSNFNNDTGHTGSQLWFPVTFGNSKGYVSAYDIVNVVTGGSGGGGKPDDYMGFQVPVNAGRNTVDQWAFLNGMHGHSVGEE